MIRKSLILAAFISAFFTGGYSAAETGLIEFINSVKNVSFCNTEVPLEKNDARERLEKELLLISDNRPQVILWLKRSGRYFPVIEDILKQENLPDDLKYLAVVESALRPHIRSPQNAVGFWQFIHSTGLLHGLKIDKSVDERCDIKKSTYAAAMYLKELFKRFENWELVLAAYNIGEMRIERELEAQSAEGYYDLWLPEETMRYVFRVIAAKIVFENRDELGYSMKESDYYKAWDTKELKLNLNYTVPASVAAHALDLSLYEFKLINTEIIGDYLIKGDSYINVPDVIDSEKFIAEFDKHKNKWIEEHTIFYYTVKRGDSLIKIADEFEVRIKDILEWNKLDYKDYIYPGQKLVIKTNSQNLNLD
ncbi:MAG: transglycosylase SLT domain-containing protein [Desulfobacteraceae bacterium]